MKISSNDILEAGQFVKVSGMRGVVIKCDVERDQFGLPISVHTVRLMERFHSRQAGYKPLEKPITKKVNYSFIDTTN